MATITFSMASTPFTGSKTFTGSDVDMADFLQWGAFFYGAYIQATFNPGGNPAFVPTNAQIAAAIANNTVQFWKESVVRFKNNNAIQALPTPPTPGWA